MYLTNEIDVLIEMLRANSYFDDIKIIKAFPYSMKATRLAKTVIAVSPSKVEGENISIGDNKMFGEYSIDFDVFIPILSGTPVKSDVIEQIVTTVSACYPSGISVSAITVNNDISCTTAKCTFTFSGEISIGGNSDGTR
jgi:hypothetical protein